MTEKRKPWMKWYPADWRADPKLRLCSLQARGLWADMLSLMHEAEPYGHLLVEGMMPSIEELASLSGAPLKTVAPAFAELERRGVFSRASDGVIFSRRIVRDKAKADQDSANGKGGGNPKLKTEDKGGVNPPDKPAVDGGDKAHMPEARKKEPEAKASGKKHSLPKTFMLTPERHAVAVGKGIPHERVAAEFERFCTWAIANNRKYANWDAAWRNWCSSPYQQSHQNSPSSPGQRPSPPGSSGIVRASMAVIAANSRREHGPVGVQGGEAFDRDGAGGDSFAFEGLDPAIGSERRDPGADEMPPGHEVARKAG